MSDDAKLVVSPRIAKRSRRPRTYHHFVRDAVALMCRGKAPPLSMVIAYFTTDDDALQWWCFEHRGEDWLTGIGIVEAAEALVDESISNANLIDEVTE